MDPLTALGVFALTIVVAGVVSAALFAKRAHQIGSGDRAAHPDHNVTEKGSAGAPPLERRSLFNRTVRRSPPT